MSLSFRLEGNVYNVCGHGCCILMSMTGKHECFRVPSAISIPEGKRYLITGISQSACFNADSPNTVSFERSSEITCVPLSFIGQSKSTFFLPPKVKRVLCSEPKYSQKIILESSYQRFVSTLGSLVIMNHFPLELAYQHLHTHRCYIRETVLFVGDYSFYYNQSVTSVVFPSSIEYIGDSAFCNCTNLQHIRFKKGCKLLIIGKRSFSFSALESIDIPSDVEEIEDSAFYCCTNLRSVTFQWDSKLRVIGKSSFRYSNLESVKIPSKVDEIGDFAFDECKKMSSVTFSKDAKFAKIGVESFGSTSLVSVKIPSNVEEI